MTAPDPSPGFAPLRALAGVGTRPDGVAVVKLRLMNEAISCDFDLDPNLAAQWSTGLAQAIAQAAADAQKRNSGGLIVPPHQAGKGLFLPNGNGNGQVSP